MAERFRWNGTPLTLAELDEFAAHVAKDAPVGTPKHNQAMRVFIVMHFLGEDWYLKHAHIDSHPDSFFFPEFNEQDFAPRYSIMLLQLAEMLFNLQDMPGFATCLEHMSLNQMESGMAELQVGMVLKQQSIRFRYVDPKVDDTKTYDLEIQLSTGEFACGEVKCKYERTPYSDATLRNALGEARKQIGAGNNGIVFVKIPQDWVGTEHVDASVIARVKLPPEIIAATKSALRVSKRLKKVIFYVFYVVYEAAQVGATHATMEMSNEHNGAGSPWSVPLLTSPRIENWLTIPQLVERWHNQSSAGR